MAKTAFGIWVAAASLYGCTQRTALVVRVSAGDHDTVRDDSGTDEPDGGADDTGAGDPLDRCDGVVCTAVDACHEAGACDPATGLCANPEKPNGASCDDGDYCTEGDSCQSRVCTGTPIPFCLSVVFVDAQAAGRGDGTTWQDAFVRLQDALALSTAGTFVWVAGGVYVPGTAKTDTFQVGGGVEIYGGFSGRETNLDQRSWSENVTVLSGDGIGNDAGFVGNEENVYHVVTPGGDFAVIDGFTITGGNADYPTYDPALGRDRGGGIYNTERLTVRHCTFVTNNAAYMGGAMYSAGAATIRSSVFRNNVAANGGALATFADHTIVDGLFLNNSASSGGALFHSGETWVASRVTSCRFIGNRASYRGGAVLVTNTTPLFVGSVFTGNQANDRGGAVHTESNGRDRYVNCTFASNTAGWGGAIRCDDVAPTPHPIIVNSVIWNNVPDAIPGCSAVATISYTCVQGGAAGTGNIVGDPLFADSNGTDNLPGTLDDDARLTAASPAIDACDNSALPADLSDLDGDGNMAEPVSLDLDGSPRFVEVLGAGATGNGTPPLCDLGAYELVP